MQFSAREMRRFGTYLLLAAGGVLGIVLGVLFAVSNRPSGPPPTPTIPIPEDVLATATSAPSWHVTFTAPVAGGPWPEGTHDYDLQITCQDGTRGSWQGSFIATSQFERQNERVYLRTSGVLSAETGGEPVAAIAPSQPLGAAVTLVYSTLELADSARASCEAVIQVDDLPAQRLSPRIPVER